jgi:hypothetical protein
MNDNGCRITQLGPALQLAVAGPMPVVLEFSGESLVALLMAAQAAFRERKKPDFRGRRNSAAKRRVA